VAICFPLRLPARQVLHGRLSSRGVKVPWSVSIETTVQLQKDSVTHGVLLTDSAGGYWVALTRGAGMR